jgi:hypothetical protein
VTCASLFNPRRAPFINFMGHNISLKLVGHKILRYKSNRYLRSAKNTVVEKINILNPCR